MTSLRARTWGYAEWTTACFDGDEEVEERMVGLLGARLAEQGMHVQVLDDEGDWADWED